mgnify:CR=1 FL=1
MSLLFLSHCIRRLLRSRSAVVSLVCVSILCAVAGAYTTYRNTEYGQANKEVIDRVVSANEGFAADLTRLPLIPQLMKTGVFTTIWRYIAVN